MKILKNLIQLFAGFFLISSLFGFNIDSNSKAKSENLLSYLHVIVSDIPDQTAPEGSSFTINLNDYVSDPFYPDEQINWDYSGALNLNVSINSTTNVATITPLSADWNGSVTITFTANNQNVNSGLTSIGSWKYNTITNHNRGEYKSIRAAPITQSGSLIGDTIQSDLYGAINKHPSASISGIDSICPGDTATLTIILTRGVLPWSFTYTRNGRDRKTISGINNVTYNLESTQDGNYVLTSMRDAFHDGKVSGTGKVIYRKVPTAILSGGETICEGTIAALNANLTGTSPWKITYKKDNLTASSVDNILSSPSRFEVNAAGKYTLNSVTDRYCSGTVTGSAIVSVISAPDVKISGLNQAYSVESNPVPISGSPIGGEFFGEGLLNKDDTVFFLPAWAGIEGSPHKISYIYQSPSTGCFGKDSVLVDILTVQANFIFPDNRLLFCYNDEPFIVKVANSYNVIGQFIISGGVGLTDNGDNTAIIDPFKLAGGIYEVTYKYFYKTWFSRTEKITIEYVNPIWFIGFEKNIYCTNDNTVLLNGNVENGVFSGSTVTGNNQQGYYFWPAYARTGNDTIFYTLNTINGCSRSVSEVITINKAPVIDFNTDENCISNNSEKPIKFINKSESTDSIVSWRWDFDDPGSGANNISSETNPTHYYTSAGSYYVSLQATDNNGCVGLKDIKFSFGNLPHSDFVWNSECFHEGQSIELTNKSTIKVGILDKYKWNIRSSDMSEESDSENVSILFNNPGDYLVSLVVETNFGCLDSVEKTFPVRPTIKVTGNNYFEDFETGLNGWSSAAVKSDGFNSWNFGNSDNGFPGGAASGINSWYTKLQYGTKEQSWVISPCFDFSYSKKPMIKFDALRDFDQLRDGAVLQYTDDNGSHWANIGDLNDGINWYNVYDIIGNPGEQQIGWSNIKDTNWVEMRHSLDSLVGMSQVQFRIAYGSDGTNTYNNGFAFDNFWLGERTKMVLLEHFTNNSDTTSILSNQILENIIDNLNKDVINLEYHTSFPGNDLLNLINPMVPEARVFYYGLSNVPYTLMDGGINGKYLFDYHLKDPDKKDLLLESLKDPEFQLKLNTIYSDNSVNINVTMTALKAISLRELTLHSVIIEKELNDINSVYGPETFYNVVRDFIPNTSGTYIYKTWNPGSEENINYTWNYSNVTDKEQLRVIVFLQDESTKEIFQAAIDKTDFLSPVQEHPHDNLRQNFICSPNPADNHAILKFSQPLLNNCILTLQALDGKIILQQKINAGAIEYNLNTSSLAQDAYIISVSSNYHLLKPVKLIISH